MVVDSTTHNLYLVYTRFDAAADNIEFQRSTNQGVTWTNPVQVSARPRAASCRRARGRGAGPTAPVYVAWYSIGSSTSTSTSAQVHHRRPDVRRSDHRGLAYHAFENGRPDSTAGTPWIPSLAVDRTVGGATAAAST